MRKPVGRAGTGAALLLAALVAGACTAQHPGSLPTRASEPPDVGSNPAVQRWFTEHEADRLAVDDALQRAYWQLDRTPAGAGGCTALVRATAAMLASLPTPKRTLDPQVVAGIAQFRTGAEQCLAGDLAAARASLAAGAQARANAETELDEILEEPDSNVT